MLGNGQLPQAPAFVPGFSDVEGYEFHVDAVRGPRGGLSAQFDSSLSDDTATKPLPLSGICIWPADDPA